MAPLLGSGARRGSEGSRLRRHALSGRLRRPLIGRRFAARLLARFARGAHAPGTVPALRRKGRSVRCSLRSAPPSEPLPLSLCRHGSRARRAPGGARPLTGRERPVTPVPGLSVSARSPGAPKVSRSGTGGVRAGAGRRGVEEGGGDPGAQAERRRGAASSTLLPVSAPSSSPTAGWRMGGRSPPAIALLPAAGFSLRSGRAGQWLGRATRSSVARLGR